MGNFIIKTPATDLELDGKAFVHYTAWNESYTGLIPQAYLDTRSLEQCRTIARSPGANTLVAVTEEQVAGFASYLPDCRSFVSVPDSCEVVALYVLERYKGQGIGTALLQRCLRELPEEKAVVLFVLEGNEKAIRFYEKQGFVFTGHALAQKIPGGEIRELEMVLTDRPAQG